MLFLNIECYTIMEIFIRDKDKLICKISYNINLAVFPDFLNIGNTADSCELFQICQLHQQGKAALYPHTK